MPEKREKEVVKVSDFTENFKSLTGLVRENYLASLKLFLTLWEDNLKFANAQFEQYLLTQKEYADQLKGILEKFSGQTTGILNGSYQKAFDGTIDRISGIQRQYIDLLRNTSEKFTKETVSLTQKTADRAFSFFEEYINQLKV
jgi:hypothetical protein